MIVVRKLKGEDRLDITLHEVLSDVDARDGRGRGAAREGRRGARPAGAAGRRCRSAAARASGSCAASGRPTSGPVDLMCRDDEDGWVAVEIKRVGTIDAVEQLSRYLERIRLDPALADCARRARRPGRQAAGARAGRGARAALGRGRPRGAARRARAGADAVRRMSDEPVLAEARDGVLDDHAQPPRGAQRGQRRGGRGRRRGARPPRRRRRAARRRSSPAPASSFCAGMDLKAFVAGRAALRGGPRLRGHRPAPAGASRSSRRSRASPSPAASRSRWPAT